MATKSKRKARKELVKKIDTTVPVPLEILGSQDDPCFGKLNDPRNPTCMKCGDSEICAIAMGQNNHILRAKTEKKLALKDVEEKDIVPPNKKEQKKLIRARMKELIKQGPIDKEEIIKDLYGKYLTDGWRLSRLKKILDSILEKYQSSIITKNNKVQWKKSQ